MYTNSLKHIYLQLELRHNRMNDPDVQRYLWGVASFRLDDVFAEFPDLKGLKIRVRTSHGMEVFTRDFENTDNQSEISETDERSVSSYLE